jgi:hypothetical protein
MSLVSYCTGRDIPQAAERGIYASLIIMDDGYRNRNHTYR